MTRPIYRLTKVAAFAGLSLGVSGCSIHRARSQEVIGIKPQPWVQPNWDGRRSNCLSLGLEPETTWLPAPREIRERRIEPSARLFRNDPMLSLESPFGQIDYFRIGPQESKFTVLFLPGIPGLAYDFHAPAIRLAELGLDVVSVSPPGLGHSTRNPMTFRYTVDDYARFYRYFIQSMDLQNVLLVVNSYSAVTGPHALCRYGREDLRVKGIIYLNPVTWGIYPAEYSIPEGEQLIGNSLYGHLLLALFHKFPKLGIADGYRHYLAGLPAKEREFYLQEYLKHWYADSRWRLWMDAAEVRDIHEATRGQNLTYQNREGYGSRLSPFLPRLKDIPILFISAAEDDVVPRPYALAIYDVVNRLSGHPQNSFIGVDRVGHMTMLLEPNAVEKVSHEIANWARSLE